VRTGLLTGLSVPVVPHPVHYIIPLLQVVSLSFPGSYWMLDSAPFYTPCLYLCPFPSNIHFTLKMENAIKASNLTSFYYYKYMKFYGLEIFAFKEYEEVWALYTDLVLLG